MGLIDNMKTAIKGTSKWLRSKLQPTAPSADGTSYANTTATRRAARLRNTSFTHVSVPMGPNPLYQLFAAEFGDDAAKTSGLSPFSPDIAKMPMGKGITLNLGIKKTKRAERRWFLSNGYSRKVADKWAYDAAQDIKQGAA